MTNTTFVDPRPELIAAAGHFYQQGWMVGTAGNLSTRLADGSFWITASGRSKGELQLSDFIRIYPDGRVEQSAESFKSNNFKLNNLEPDRLKPKNLKPSAETSIHQSIYTLFPDAIACYHVHSVEANLVSDFTDSDNLSLPPLEMLKGLGVWKENPSCEIAVFNNHLRVPQIAAEIEQRFSKISPQIPALLIRNHGVTVWGKSATQTRNYIELIEYIFRYMVAQRKIR